MSGGGGKGGADYGYGGIGVDPFAIGKFTQDQAEMAPMAQNASENIGASTMTTNELGGAFNTGAQAAYGADLQQNQNQYKELQALASASAANEGQLGNAAGLLGGITGGLL